LPIGASIRDLISRLEPLVSLNDVSIIDEGTDLTAKIDYTLVNTKESKHVKVTLN
jgi:hypothetical protein